MVETIQSPTLEKDLNELDGKLNELKTRYEQYFIGVEKREPLQLRKQVNSIVNRYSGQAIQNTQHKFRYNTLISRYNAFQQYWNRVLKEMEEGRYQRDVFKAKLREEERGVSPTSKDKPPASADAKETKPATPAAANDPIGQLFQQYMTARQRNQESVEGMSREKLEGVIKQQSAAIQQQYGVKKVSFKVVVEDGKTKIKAVPKKS